MSVVTATEKWPAAGMPFTVAELDRMPDDGRRYELLDGTLVVSPRPSNPHQEVAAELLCLLRAACPAGLRALPEPAVQCRGGARQAGRRAAPGVTAAAQALRRVPR
jgi:Putative restriction endonuclease